MPRRKISTCERCGIEFIDYWCAFGSKNRTRFCNSQCSPELRKEVNTVQITGILSNDRIRVMVNRRELSLEPSLRLRNHSPTGFAWGYNGSGPSQLALAVLLETCPQADALNYYQRFREDHVSQWPFGKDFNVTVDIVGWLTKVLYEDEDKLGINLAKTSVPE